MNKQTKLKNSFIPAAKANVLKIRKQIEKINIVKSSDRQIKSSYIDRCCTQAGAPALPSFSRSHGHWLMQNAYTTVIESDRVLTDEATRIRAELNEGTKSTALVVPSLFTVLFFVIDVSKRLALYYWVGKISMAINKCTLHIFAIRFG